MRQPSRGRKRDVDEMVLTLSLRLFRLTLEVCTPAVLALKPFITVFVLHLQSRPLLRLGQRVLDPLQQFLADGCHLTRNPLPAIEATGFREVEASRFEVEGMSLIAPHVAGIARA
jgi:hypothetical protein